MSKEAILGNLKASLAHNRLEGAQVSYENPMTNPVSSPQERLQEFIALQEANKAIVVQSSPESLAKDIRQAFEDCGAKKVLYNPDIEAMESVISALEGREGLAYETSVDSMREEIFSIDTSIVQARCGVANLGIIGVASGVMAPRLSSLVTQNCIVLLKKEDIIEHLYAGVNALKARGEGGKLPTNMIFIAGPSRTADIELQTVFGVHGSTRTFVILY